jgi:SAM-dependent methyltransferase
MDSKSGLSTDPSGWKTLELFAEAPAFNKWLFDQISPFCKGAVLEAGSGIGNISGLLLDHHFKLTLSDMRAEYCRLLKHKFGASPDLQAVHQLDLALPDFESRYPDLLNRFDTVVALNVVEHIKEDALAVRNAAKLLRNEGNLIVLVPSGRYLYNRFDRELGHYRRYSGKAVSRLLTNAGLQVFYSGYFNSAGIAGWWFSGSVLKKKIIPGSQLKIFDRLVPAFRILDQCTKKIAGLSVISVAAKQMIRND